MKQIKAIPYGIANFVEVVEQNMYYADKTMYLPKLENQPKNLFLIRPRRFGKSIFLSMLRAYYDIAQKDKFQARFGDLWIGHQPTKLQGQFQIVYFDFSKASAGSESLAENFDRYCCGVLDNFAFIYASYYESDFEKEMRSQPDAASKLNYLNLKAANTGSRLYLIIDEYDNFANTVLNEQGSEMYHALTHASGFYREAFKIYKGMFERIFMMGVSPVTLDDLTSGFNIGWSISTDPDFNMMLGFSETEVREMLQYYKETGALEEDVEAMITEIKPWYDNYCFAPDSLETDPKIFNCDMVLYYLNNYLKRGKAPEQMIDPNTRTDYNKMKRLIQLDRLDGNRKGVIQDIAEKGFIITNLVTSFPAEQIARKEIFPSLLFYYGMLTITGTRGSRLILSIPNNNVRKQYYEYMLEEYQASRHLDLNDLLNAFDSMAFNGNWRPAMEFISEAYKNNSSVRSAIEGERNIQGFFTAYLSINSYYLLSPEVELNHGYCDMFLLPNLRYPETAHSYIIELKYLSVKDYDSQADKQWNEAVEQIHGYAKGEKVFQLSHGTKLHLLIIQFKGWEVVRMEEII
jgi:hypothetical protein